MQAQTQPKIQLPTPPDGVRRMKTVRPVERLNRLRARRDRIQNAISELPWSEEWRDRVRELYNKRSQILEQIDAIEVLGDGGPRLTVTLDDYGSTLVRRALSRGSLASPADVAVGALTFMLSEEDGQTPDEEIDKAFARRQNQPAEKGIGPTYTPAGHAVTIRLTPVQMRMLVQVADEHEGDTAAEVIRRELGEHVAHMLECFHGHDLDKVRARWDQEGAKL